MKKSKNIQLKKDSALNMKKNLAIIVPKLRDGGAERVAANLSILLQNDYQIHLIVFDGSNIQYPYSGMLHDLQLPPLKGWLHKLQQFIKRVRAVRNIKHKYQIEVTLSLMDGANLVNILSQRGDKIITSVHIVLSQSRFNTTLSRWINIFIMKFTAKYSSRVVAVSEGVRNDLIVNFGLSPQQVYTIYNSVDVNQIHNLIKSDFTKKQNNSHSIITMGRLVAQKGQWHLIRAFAEVIKTVPDAKLYILGNGPLRNELEQLAQGKNISDHVEFLGFQKDPYSYLAQSKVFVLSSLYEGFGNVLIEAMACATPCISTDCPSGPREILAPNTSYSSSLNEVEYAEYGVLIPVDTQHNFDVQSPLSKSERLLKEGIVRLLTDEFLLNNYKIKGLKRCHDFSFEAIKEEWINFLESNF